MQVTYIFGHRNPDTDSICSSIALSYLKNKLGEKTQPRAIGHLNNETKFVLDYFHVQAPQYLNDVRIRMKNIKYDKKGFIKEDDCIFQAFKKMQEQNISGISIVDKDKKLIGFTSLKDLSKFLINSDKEKIDTNIDNLTKTLNATVLTNFKEQIAGNVMVVGLGSSTFQDEVKLSGEDILIVGDRYKVIKYAIESEVQLIILAKDSVVDKELIDLAKQKRVTIISSKLSSFQLANKVFLSNYITCAISTKNPIFMYDDDYYTEFLNLNTRVNHTNYPIINHKNVCMGLISLSWPNKFEKQKVILVDHNNVVQSVVGIEEAEIIEVIDHHNLGALGTAIPIDFRSKTVGATATIIYEYYVEKKVPIPKNIAGLLISAILSDTMILTSPTTTEEDRLAVLKLSKIAKVDINEYGYKMIKASSSIKGMTITQQIYQDYKSYTVGSRELGIGQLATMDFDEIKTNIDKYVKELDQMHLHSDGIYALFITDVINKGSYVIYSTDSKNIIKDAFNLDEVYQGIFLDGIVSRKKQVLPAIMNVM